MRSAVVLVAGAMVLGSVGVSTVSAAEQPAAAASAGKHEAMRKSLADLQTAREHLANANREFASHRHRALEAVQFAIIQTYASLGDAKGMMDDYEKNKKWMEEEQETREQQAKHKYDPSGQHVAMKAALADLEKARDGLKRAREGDFGPYGKMAATFVDQALSEVQAALATVPPAAK